MRFVLNKQDDEFSCGVFALQTLLSAHDIHIESDLLKALIKPDPETGTSHRQIIEVLEFLKIPYAEIHRENVFTIPVPSIVNYQWEGDGHYAVIVGLDPTFVWIANPGNGHLEKVRSLEFVQNWYSKRYGKYWALRIL